MTCIVGLVAADGVYIGGDSAGTNDVGQQTVRADPKVFRRASWLFGGTSSYRMIQLLHYALVLPPFQEGEDLLRYLAIDFIDAVRTCFKNGGYATRDEEQEQGGTFLVGFRGRLFCIDGDYQVGESQAGYQAIGSGDDLALGALYATQAMDMRPKQRITLALEAAAAHHAHVRPPFLIERIPHDADDASFSPQSFLRGREP